MAVKKRIVVALFLTAAVFLWAALFDWEFGKYDSLEEAVEKGIPYKVKDVVHTQNVDGVTVVMYTTEPDREVLPYANYDALAVAFFEGNDENGWVNIGPNGWNHYENDNMTVYVEILRDHDSEGNLKHHLPVVYGEINNAVITKVETKSKQETEFEAAEMITYKGKRYYFQVGDEFIVRGLSKEGEVIDRQGG